MELQINTKDRFTKKVCELDKGRSPKDTQKAVVLGWSCTGAPCISANPVPGSRPQRLWCSQLGFGWDFRLSQGCLANLTLQPEGERGSLHVFDGQ